MDINFFKHLSKEKDPSILPVTLTRAPGSIDSQLPKAMNSYLPYIAIAQRALPGAYKFWLNSPSSNIESRPPEPL